MCNYADGILWHRALPSSPVFAAIRLLCKMANWQQLQAAAARSTTVAGRYVVLAQGPYTAVPAGPPLPDIDVYPLLGPMGGGTTVMLQVSTT